MPRERSLDQWGRLAISGGLSQAERLAFMAKLRRIDARRKSKPPTDEEISDSETDYLENGELIPGEEDDEDEDQLGPEDEPEKLEMDEAEEGEETDHREKRLKPDYQHRKREPSEADSDACHPARRGGEHRAALEAELRHLAQAHSKQTGWKYEKSYMHVMLHTEKGKRIAEALTLATPT
jgi:hypothetical protein